MPDEGATGDTANTVFEETADQLVIRPSAGVAYSTLAVLAAWGGMAFGVTILFCAGTVLSLGIWLVIVPFLAWIGYMIHVSRTNRITITLTRREITICHSAWVFPTREARFPLSDCRQAFVSRRRTVRLPTGGVFRWYVLLKYGFFIDQYYVYLARARGWRRGVCTFANREAGQQVAERINRFLRWKATPVVSTWYQRFPLLEATNDDKTTSSRAPGVITASSFPVPAWSVGCLMMVVLNGLGVLLMIRISLALASNQDRPQRARTPVTRVQPASTPGPAGRAHPLLGQPAPPINLSRSDGTAFPWASHFGREIMIVGFFNGTDPANRRMLGEFATLSSGNVGPKLAACTVCTGEAAEVAQPIWRNQKFPLDLLVDADGAIHQQYHIDHWPCVFVVDTQGVVRWYQWGDSASLTADL
ncbi:MAG: peroxiredoxin family protein, partial [Pirellulaceae bacterium]